MEKPLAHGVPSKCLRGHSTNAARMRMSILQRPESTVRPGVSHKPKGRGRAAIQMDRRKLMGRCDPTPPKLPSRKAQRLRGYLDHPPAPAALASEAEVRVQAESTPRFSLKSAQEIERRAGDQRANGRYPSSPVDIWRGPQNALNAVSWQYTGPDPVSVTRRSTDMCLSVAMRCCASPLAGA